MFYISLVDLNSNIVISHNNKLLKFKKINGKYVACINEAQATLTFIHHHELDTHLWFLKAFIFYIISFFGLFMKRYSKNFFTLNVSIKFVPQLENYYYDITLNDNQFSNNPIIINGEQYYFLNENKFTINEKAKKNFHTFKVFSILIRLTILILMIIFLIIFII